MNDHHMWTWRVTFACDVLAITTEVYQYDEETAVAVAKSVVRKHIYSKSANLLRLVSATPGFCWDCGSMSCTQRSADAALV